MSESGKTIAFIVVAVAAVGLSYVTKPQSVIYDVNAQIGQMLTAAFEPEAAKRLKIVKFNEETAELSKFEVAEQDGVWTLPSKGGYPADAFQQIAEATTGVTDREILEIASESAADHEKFGVVDPGSSKLEVGQTGVGLRVTMADENNEPLADLVIGKEVKDRGGLRYVRRQSQDVVYVVKIDPTRFSTEFETWIEKDLLKIESSDIARVQIKDYSLDVVSNFQGNFRVIKPRGEYTLAYDNGDKDWRAEKLLEFDAEARDFRAFELAAGEALNQDVLSDLMSALDDVRIVDVESKPASLSADLQASKDFLDNDTAISSLAARGYAPVKMPEDRVEILSTEGEVLCTLDDGVEYVLRFGDIESSGDQPASEGDAEEDTDADSGVNRYLFVVARLNDSVIEKPELEEVPDEATAEPAGEGADEDVDAPTEKGKEEDDDVESVTDDESGDETKTDGDDATDDAESERNAIISRNKQKMEAYEAKVAAAEQRVEELNERFGDWYYVVADSVFKKIRLTRNDFIKIDEKEDGDAATDDNNASVLGAPGAPIPGLPGIDLGASPADEADPPTGDDAAPENESETAPNESAPDESDDGETEKEDTPPAAADPNAA